MLGKVFTSILVFLGNSVGGSGMDARWRELERTRNMAGGRAGVWIKEGEMVPPYSALVKTLHR